MQIYLIRHTTPEIGNDVCYGQSDIALADSFDKEKGKVLASISTVLPFDIVYSSPLKRCTDLANCLSGVAPIIDDRLLELNFGDWELIRWNDINRQAFDFWASNFVTKSPPGGESLESVYQRTETFIEHLLEQTYEFIAVVTHAGIIRCFWAKIMAMPLANVFQLNVDYGDVFSIKITKGINDSSIEKI